MPIIKSAKKRVRVIKKATVRNAKTKRQLREAVKAFKTAVSKGKSDKIIEAQKEAFSAIDTAAKKNVIHKNKAARKKSQLAKEAKSAGAKIAKTTKAKPATKAAPAKKVVAKKPATKKTTPKTTVKKPAAKKTTPKK